MRFKCIYKNCTNATDTIKRSLRNKVTFFPFPNPNSELAKFHKWMILSDIDEPALARKKESSICSEHFLHGKPTKEDPNPKAHDESISTNNEPQKKTGSKRQLPPRKYAGKTIVIDDEPPQPQSQSPPPKTPPQPQAPPPEIPPKVKGTISTNGEVVETLQMLCWNEDLSPVQKEREQKREKEYKEILTKLDNMIKQSGGELIHKSEGFGLQAFQLNLNPPTLTTFPQQQANGVADFSNPPALAIPTQNNVVLQTKGPSAGNYKLVLDPRLGMVIGTMTPTGQINSTNQSSLPQNKPVVQQTTMNMRSAKKTRSGRTLTNTNVPITSQPIQFAHPSPVVTNTSNAVPISTPTSQTSNVRPAESTAVGGLSAGTTAAKQPPPAIVDLTADDGRPAADSREVAFNKLQGKTFPSLVVVARPHLHAKEAASANDRGVLDTKVKSVLVHTPTKFTEWLIQQGLVRSEQHCTVHPANKLNLGMYSDVSKFPFSGGYVWISECCPHRFVSVFSGSLFEGAAHSPTVLLKLIYHWACQTNIQNVVQWVKVDNLYVKGLFTWLRAVCSYALQQHLKPMGGAGRKIEVGVISLGTTSQDGSQRQVKVEVLGILDPESRLIRLRAVEPLADGERNYKRRFSKILEPLRNWVHRDSIIATDLTVDKGTLHYMGFANIIQSTQTGVPGNQGVMEYLRKIVPRMFQNTLSLLSRQIIQQFLDELVWREWFGQTAAQAFNNMVIHIAEQTRMNVGDTLIHRLNKVAANPFKNHAICYQAPQPDKITETPPIGVKRYSGRKRAANTTPTAIIDLEKPAPKKVHISEPTSGPIQVNNDPMVPIESYYYGTIEGEANAPLAQKIKLNIRCCVCKVQFTNNIKLLDHLLAHAHNITQKNAVSQCRYCLASLPSVEELNTHIGDLHPVETRGYGNVHPACVICEQRFTSIYMLGKHMSREHVPQELPYQCGTCGFRTSSHRQAIDHFYNSHDGAATVQCPFCLKSTAVWSSGRNMSTNVTFFLAHLQKHQKKSMAKKCHKCALWFIQKETLKDHMTKSHAPMIGKRNFRVWPLPSNYVMVPKSKIFSNSSDSPPPFYQQPGSPPEEINSLHKLTFIIPPNMKCKECHKVIDSSEHFPQKLSCESCAFITDCFHTMQTHKIKCRKTSIPTIHRLPLNGTLHCVCGYTNSYCGNQMAKHLALCERKTAYPSPESAKIAVDSNTHSMLDVLGLMRRNDDSKDEKGASSAEELEPDSAIVQKPVITTDPEIIPIDDDEEPEIIETEDTLKPDEATSTSNDVEIIEPQVVIQIDETTNQDTAKSEEVVDKTDHVSEKNMEVKTDDDDKKSEEKESVKEASEKEVSEKEVSGTEVAEKETSEKEDSTQKETSEKEDSAQKEASEKEASEKETSEKEASEKEVSGKEVVEKEVSEKEDLEKEALEKDVDEAVNIQDDEKMEVEQSVSVEEPMEVDEAPCKNVSEDEVSKDEVKQIEQDPIIDPAAVIEDLIETDGNSESVSGAKGELSDLDIEPVTPGISTSEEQPPQSTE